ncbi:MAG TPA: AmmeMemoRadiSam system protein A [Verrucomicrobiae bacterium]|nr:AmmeMemoRadiSam system protein A [Verrucomicrobiae bacterium]
MVGTHPASRLTEPERAFLLELARRTLQEQCVSGRSPDVDPTAVALSLRQPRACFVTLLKHGELRGCVGNLQPREPLYLAVMHNAAGAAFRDNRFAPVSLEEIQALHIEISILGEPVKATLRSPEDLLGQLRPGVDGVILKVRGRTATFLPQVWEKVSGPVEFMEALAHKAMLPGSAWRDPTAVVMTYQVEHFEEPAPAAGLN